MHEAQIRFECRPSEPGWFLLEVDLFVWGRLFTMDVCEHCCRNSQLFRLKYVVVDLQRIICSLWICSSAHVQVLCDDFQPLTWIKMAVAPPPPPTIQKLNIFLMFFLAWAFTVVILYFEFKFGPFAPSAYTYCHWSQSRWGDYPSFLCVSEDN